MTQSIEIKDFTGGRNFITNAFSIYPTEAEEMANVTVDSSGMSTKNYILDKQVIPAKAQPTDPIQIAPQSTYIYDMTTATENYYEKVRFYQGNDYVLINGIPNRLALGVASPTFVTNTLNATAPQNTGLPIPDLAYTKVEQYTYYISYRNSAGFESPLEKLNTVNAHRTFDTNYTTETASEQTIVVTAPPAAGAYGRIYRMGGNISFPSLVFQFDSTWAVSLERGTVTSASGTFTFSLLDDKLGEYSTTWGGVHPPYLRYLTATKFGLAAANGSQVYLSMSKPDAWSALNSLNFGSNIIAIASVYRGFLVFTESTYLYFISGSSLATLRVDLISTDIGCSSNASIGEVGQHALVWLYKRKFFMFDGASVKELEPNTYDYQFFVKNNFNKDAIGVSYEGQYIAATDRGLVTVPLHSRYKPFIDFDIETTIQVEGEASLLREILIDNTRKIGTYKSDGSFWSLREYVYGDIEYTDPHPPTEGWAVGAYTNPPVADIDSTVCVYQGGFSGYVAVAPDPCSDDGALLGNYTNALVLATAQVYRSNYLGPKLAFNAQTALAKFSVFEVLYEGELIAKAFIDDTEVVSKEFISGTKSVARIQIPSKHCNGKWIQIRLDFMGKIYSYRVDGEAERTH